jgi:hypothetical protein
MNIRTLMNRRYYSREDWKMIALLFVILVTVLSVYISYSISTDVTWFDYYKGGILGFFFSGAVLYAINKRRRAKEMKKSDRR